MAVENDLKSLKIALNDRLEENDQKLGFKLDKDEIGDLEGNFLII